jgi:glucosamine 6-phosphate synthetase-like amidotransferase/phosphosugar isomerase protein
MKRVKGATHCRDVRERTDKLLAARLVMPAGLPLQRNGEMFIASDLPAILEIPGKITFLENGRCSGNRKASATDSRRPKGTSANTTIPWIRIR